MTSDTNQASSRSGRVLRRAVLYPILVLVFLAAIFVAFVMMTRFTPAPASEGAVALTGARALVGPSLAPLDDAVVIVRDGVIDTIGPRAEIEIPADAEVVDLDGATLMPGLIDLHVNLGAGSGGDGSITSMPRSIVDGMRDGAGQRRDLLAHGVTTVRSLDDEDGSVLELRQKINDGTLEGPRVLAAGPAFTSAGGPDIDGDLEVPTTAEEAREAVRTLADEDGDRVDLIKVVQDRGTEDDPLEPIAAEVLEAIVDEAQAQGLPVVAQWGTIEDLTELLALEIDGGFERLVPRGALRDGWPADLLESIVDSGLSFTPTLAATQAGLDDADGALWSQAQARVGELTQAQVPLAAGSGAPADGVDVGAGLHRELELLVETGLTPTQALQSATTSAASTLRSRELGVISPGRAADLVAFGSDPREDLAALDDVVAVWRDGRLAIDHR